MSQTRRISRINSSRFNCGCSTWSKPKGRRGAARGQGARGEQSVGDWERKKGAGGYEGRKRERGKDTRNEKETAKGKKKEAKGRAEKVSPKDGNEEEGGGE